MFLFLAVILNSRGANMKNRSIYLFFFSIIIFELSAQQVSYPIAESIPVTDNYWGVEVLDEYRWLEDLNNDKVKSWVEEQNNLANKYLQKSSAKHDAVLMIEKFTNTRYRMPIKDRDYYFGIGRNGGLGNPAIYYKSTLRADWDLLLDMNYGFGKDKIGLKDLEVSGNSKYMAYQFNRNGSDWAEIKVLNLTSKKHLKDHLINVKFSSIAWKGDGFYYCRYDRGEDLEPAKGEKVYFHKLGDAQENDQLIIGQDDAIKVYSFKTTNNERFFILKELNEAANIYSTYYIDFTSGINTIRPLFVRQSYNDDIEILDSRKGKLIALSQGKNNGMVIEIDPADPMHTKLIIPEYNDALLIRAKVMNSSLILIYQSNQNYFIDISDYEGNLKKSLAMPVACSAGGFYGNPDDEELLFYLTSYYIPRNVYKFNVNTYDVKIFDNTKVQFNPDDIEIKALKYPSKDGTEVPIFIMHKKGIELDGNNPTLLKAYGGFGVVDMPSFDPGIVYLLEKGCVYAFANIRGGGDLGLQWALDGCGLNKQNSFDDFIAAADYLIESKYTNPNKLGITGASNGGLIVAAAMVQRPDLFRVAIPVVAPFDMLRFEKFTVGSFHKDEYGSVEDSLGFYNLLSYSPYYNINKEVNYPSVLLMTSENDDRVPAFHSYKFAAALQNRDVQKNLILMKVRLGAGHSGSASWFGRVKEKADLYSFFLNEVSD